MNTKSIIKTCLCAIVAGSAGLRLVAETWVVDKANGPYYTIQEAVDAATDGDIVFIKNGVHDQGGAVDGFSSSMANRVYLTKSLTLVGESKEGAIIKGAHATDAAAALGCGADAVRVLGINADNVVVSNLTLTGGATHNSSAGNDQPENNGGGVYVANGKTGIVLVDCIVSNNVARRAGAVRAGNDASASHANCLLVRTWLHENKAGEGGSPAVRGCLVAHSLLTRHYSTGNLTYAATFVNCTFADGYCRNQSGSAEVTGYNCLFADAWYKDDGTARWFNCAFNKEAAETTSTTNGACVFNSGFDLFMAPPLVDYRLHVGATAVIGKGDADYLTLIPEAYRNIDFYGHAVNAASVSLGCAQEIMTPTGGTLTFAGQAGMSEAKAPTGHAGSTTTYGLYSFNGMALGAAKDLGYIRTMEGRTVVTVTHDPTGATQTSARKGLHSFAASGADMMRRFAQMDGAFILMAPPAGKTLTLTPTFNDAVLTVDRASTAAAPAPDGTEVAPYASIQAAINAVGQNKFATIRVKAGVYDNEKGLSANGLLNRVFSNWRKVRLVSVDGRGKAVLLGAPDPSVAIDAWPFGCGAGAMRCAFLQADCAIQGFALTGGHTGTASDMSRRGGALWLDGGASALDCIITNNVGRQGVAINGQESGIAPTAFALRCFIADNYPITDTAKTGGTSGLVRSTTVGSSIFFGNHGCCFGTYERQYTFHTTFADAAEADYAGCLLAGGTNVNAVIFAQAGRLNGPTILGGVFRKRATDGGDIWQAASSSFVEADPLLADPAQGDFRLGATSPARTCGVTAHDEFVDATKAAYYMFGATDFSGKIFRLFDGKPVCGAVDLYAPTVVINGQATVLGVSSDHSVSYTCTSDDPHPFLGLEVTADGVVTTNATKSFTYTVAGGIDNPNAYELTIRDLFDSNWHVSDAAGDDANDGSAAQPKKTLAGALQYAVAGDTVHVAAGTYATGTMTQTRRFGNVGTDAYAHKARAVVPSGVSVIGAGAETTFIVGASDLDAAAADKGCGPNAVRCVALAKGARLSGFTLTGGRTDVGTTALNNGDDFHGGGVLAEYGTAETLATVTDCVISNCVARRGGGGFSGIYNRVRFLDNSIIQGGNGPAVRGNGAGNCFLANCVIDRNEGYATVYYPTLVNCTFGADNTQNGNKNGMIVIVDSGDIRNCLFLGPNSAVGKANEAGEVTATRFYDCVFSPQMKAYLDKQTVFADASCTATTELAVADDLTPVIGANAAVDAANDDGYDAATWGEMDVYGNPRRVNGRRLDVGAVEVDWKATYTKAIGRRFKVTAADPDVELVEGGVSIPAGASLAATVGRAGRANGAYVLTATVNGEVCAVTQDGEAVPSLVNGVNEVRYETGATGQTELVFTADALGSTVLASIKSDSGALFILR